MWPERERELQAGDTERAPQGTPGRGEGDISRSPPDLISPWQVDPGSDSVDDEHSEG